MFTQTLDPCGQPWVSTALAMLPVLVLFSLLVVWHRPAPQAGLAGVIVAILVAWLVYGMPPAMAGFAFLNGAAFGLVPMGWIVFGAMLLYNTTVESGQFTVLRQSVGRLSGDGRVQAVLIGFAFGAFLEGAAGCGTPVAICGAILVGLGFAPHRAAVLCLIANTSPVAYGALGLPIFTLERVTGLPAERLSVMAAHQLPFISIFVPLWMVKSCWTWRETRAVWPILVVAGGTFAIAQFCLATIHTVVPGLVLFPLTDIGGGLAALIASAILLRYWQPADIAASTLNREPNDTISAIVKAWMPYVLMSVLLVAAGLLRQREPFSMGGVPSTIVLPIEGLHLQVARSTGELEKAEITLSWLTTPGTSVVVAALASMLLLRMSGQQIGRVFAKTLRQMAVPIPTIVCMLGLSYVTRYSGMDATLGAAFATTGRMYPFFAAILGWLGVFLTGTDAGSNALFGNLQKLAASNVHATGVLPHLSLEQAQVLVCTANSTGGVMGKMIDAQSICVATAATDQVGREAAIFKAVVWNSVVFAAIVGAITLVQAYVPPFTRMVP